MSSVKWKAVRSAWLEEGGRRLDCNPYMTGALEARDALLQLNVRKDRLKDVTVAMFDSGRESRTWVNDSRFGIPYMGTSAIDLCDLSNLPLISKKQVRRNPRLLIEKGWSLITRSGTIGRMAYVRQDMVGMACSEDVLRVVPDKDRILPGYLYAYLSSKYGLPLVVSGTYGAIIQHIEPIHIENLLVPRFSARSEEEVADLVDQASSARSKAAFEIEEIKNEVSLKYSLLEENLREINERRFGFETLASVVSSSGRLEATYHNALVQGIEDQIKRVGSRLLSELCQVIKPGMFKRIKVDGPEWGYGFITGSELFSIAPKPLYFVSPKTPNIGDCVLDEYWVLIQAFGQIGGLIGRSILTTPPLKGCAATDLQIQLRFSEPADAGYVCAFLSTFAGYSLLARTPIGGSIPHIHPNDVERIRIPWPADTGFRHQIGKRMLSAWDLRARAVALEDEARKRIEALIEGGE